jgi:hypothetical protein
MYIGIYFAYNVVNKSKFMSFLVTEIYNFVMLILKKNTYNSTKNIINSK